MLRRADPTQDKANPKDWSKPDNLTILPPESEITAQPLDRVSSTVLSFPVSGA
jgi:hypothetical protein